MITDGDIMFWCYLGTAAIICIEAVIIVISLWR
jgi:hypothetical protein